MADSKHPIIAALHEFVLIDNADYFGFLAEIEQQLTKENLTVLQEVLEENDKERLEDKTLARNIGWDLIHPLLPLLPESEGCLKTIALLGNPKEVILKSTEALALLEFDLEEDEQEEDDQHEAKTEESSSAATASTTANSDQLPLPLIQFQTLTSLLSTLHPRVKTKYPSRFLSTSLKAVLGSFRKATSHFAQLTDAVLSFVKTLSGTKRPHLPPRQSSSRVATRSTIGAAPDPEAQDEAPSPEENDLIKRLLQAFLTHILEDYLSHLSSDEDIPGMAWSSRIQEKLHPEMTVPGKTSFTHRFAGEEELHSRILTVSQIIALGQDLSLKSEDLYAAMVKDLTEPAVIPAGDEEPPSSAEDIPFSKVGALYFFAARHVAKVLLDTPATGDVAVSIFPVHEHILQNYLDAGPESIGTEPEALLDTILVLGNIALENNDFGEPDDDEQFNKYLQTVSLLSANTPSPSLRYHAHILTSTVLRSHPEDYVRLSFIRDTLEHCPYENLKVSAVGWLKGETLEANASTLGSSPSGLGLGLSHTHSDSTDTSQETSDSKDEESIFATQIALSTVAPFLFPDLTHDLTSPTVLESYTRFKIELSFYLAALNFYYLLLVAKPLHSVLGVGGLHQNNDIGGSFLGPLKEVSKKYKEALKAGGELRLDEGDESAEQSIADLNVLDHALERVDRGVSALNS